MLELSKKLHMTEGARPAGCVSLDKIHMRDPFIYADRTRKLYFLFGTSMEICDGVANVDPYFEVYVSEDLYQFEGPFVAFSPPAGYWGVKHYWAPEVFCYEDKYYMFASFKGGIGEDRGTAILRADKPEGPYVQHSAGHVTLKGHECLDGTFYQDLQGNPYIVFCHEWTELYYGTIKALPLSRDLTHCLSQDAIVIVDTQRDTIPWIRHMEDRRVNKKGFLTDAPFFVRTQETLFMLWSSYSVKGYRGSGSGGYVVAVCESTGGDIMGPWIHREELLLDENTGHSSVFTDLQGRMQLISHTNDTLHGQEHPVIYSLQAHANITVKKEQRDGI